VCATASAYMECGVPFAEAVQRVVHENLPKGGVRPPLLRLYVCAAGEGALWYRTGVRLSDGAAEQLRDHSGYKHNVN
jgi:hypothetical protein